MWDAVSNYISSFMLRQQNYLCWIEVTFSFCLQQVDSNLARYFRARINICCIDSKNLTMDDTYLESVISLNVRMYDGCLFS